jgi:hypothetical protein
MARSARSQPSRRRTQKGPAILVVVFLICIAAGSAWALLSTRQYTAEARVAVGERSLSALQVPGYVNATQALAANYARYVEDDATTRAAIADDPDAIIDVTATPIPESNVVRLQVTATAEGAAVDGATRLSGLLVKAVEDSAPDLDAAQAAFQTAYNDFRSARDDAAAASATADSLRSDGRASAADVQAAQDSAASLATQAATLDLRQQALGQTYRDLFSQSSSAPRLVPVLTPTSAEGNAATLLQRGVLLGALGGAVICAILVLLARRRATLRAPDLSAAPATVDGELAGA